MMKKILLSIFAFFIFWPAFSQHAVEIAGTIHPRIHQRINLIMEGNFPDSEFNMTERNIVGLEHRNDTFRLVYPLHEPRMAYVGLTYMRLVPVYMTPGDQVQFSVLPAADSSWNYRVKFSGDHAGHYNFFFDLRDEPGIPKTPVYRQGDDLNRYKRILDEIKTQKLVFLERCKKQALLSDDFMAFAKTEILNRYNYELTTPLKIVPADSFPDGYFDECRPFFNRTHTTGLFALFSYFKDLQAGKPTGYKQKFDSIVANFRGYEREIMLCTLTGLFVDRARSEKEQADIARNWKELEKQVRDSACLDYLQRASDFFYIIGKPFPDEVLDHTTVKRYADGKEMTLREMLALFEGKSLYLDFWASWCEPCCANIEDSKEAKQFLTDKGVEFIYINIFDTEAKWKESVKKYHIGKNQFFLTDRNAPIKKYLQIVGIPKYVLMNKEHKVKDCNAPRPIPACKTELQEAIRKLNPKVITFQ